MPTGISSFAEGELAGAILAGGCGRRLGELGTWLPKALLPVGGRPLLGRQLELLRSLGVRRVVILLGHHKRAVLEYLEVMGSFGLELEIAEQPWPGGSGHALGCLGGRLTTPFVLFLGDIFVAPARLSGLLEPMKRPGCSGVIAVSWEAHLPSLRKNFSVEVDEDGRVRRLVEKPAGLAPALKGCGVYLLTPGVFGAAERTSAGQRGEIGITDVLQTWISAGAHLRTACVTAWDCNLTTREDLADCNRRLAAPDRAARVPCSG